jgi:voltage-gated potassium channel
MIFSIGRKEIGNRNINEAILFIYSIAKTIYFFSLLFDRIKDTATDHLDYKDILTFIGYNTLLIVISYGIDYLCLYEIDPHSFTGITTREQLIPHIVVFFYFSVATFSTAGFGDIAPHSMVAQLLISSEMILSWFLTILVIANFSTIRDTFKKSSKDKDL